MIIGYLLAGTLAGLLASIIAILNGETLWLAFGLYTLVSSATLGLLPLIGYLLNERSPRSKDQATKDYWHPKGKTSPTKFSLNRRVSITETSIKILVVDDDPFILELIPTVLSRTDFPDIIPAASGEKALELLLNSDTTFDCLLIDINMPGMDGIELCRRVRDMPRYRQTPIVMLTAARDMQNMGDAFRAGATDYISKPFDIDAFRTRLATIKNEIYTNGTMEPVRYEDSQYEHRGAVSNYSFDQPDEHKIQEPTSLVSHSAFSSYLTQLPNKKVLEVQVFAIKVDKAVGISALPSSQLRVMREDLTSAALEHFETDQSVMAYTNDTTLLVATNSLNPMPPADIERRLLKIISAKQAGISISIGGPVHPQVPKAQRAQIVTSRAISLAENRRLGKLGGQIADYSKFKLNN